jgi:hypothetical protein
MQTRNADAPLNQRTVEGPASLAGICTEKTVASVQTPFLSVHNGRKFPISYLSCFKQPTSRYPRRRFPVLVAGKLDRSKEHRDIKTHPHPIPNFPSLCDKKDSKSHRVPQSTYPQAHRHEHPGFRTTHAHKSTRYAHFLAQRPTFHPPKDDCLPRDGGSI